MEVVIDGNVFQRKSIGGIARIYYEILPRMCDIDETLNIRLFTEGKANLEIPIHPQINYKTIPNLNFRFNQLPILKSVMPMAREIVRGCMVGHGKGKIWHSTYYTILKKWEGLTVVTVADIISELFQNMFTGSNHDQFREQKRNCILNADAILCISETTAQDVQHYYNVGSDRLHVVHLAYSNIFKRLNDDDNKLTMTNMKPFLLYVGNYAYHKNHYKNFYLLLRAYSKWSQRKNVELCVVGRPRSNAGNNRLIDLGINNHVHLLTGVDDETLCRLYNHAIALVFPSIYEGFGIPLLEAMACGCPVIASRISSTTEVAGDYPIYFDPNEVDELIEAFNIALSETRDSTRIQVGLRQVKQYSWDKTASKTLEIYREISTS